MAIGLKRGIVELTDHDPGREKYISEKMSLL